MNYGWKYKIRAYYQEMLRNVSGKNSRCCSVFKVVISCLICDCSLAFWYMCSLFVRLNTTDEICRSFSIVTDKKTTVWAKFRQLKASIDTSFDTPIYWSVPIQRSVTFHPSRTLVGSCELGSVRFTHGNQIASENKQEGVDDNHIRSESDKFEIQTIMWQCRTGLH